MDRCALRFSFILAIVSRQVCGFLEMLRAQWSGKGVLFAEPFSQVNEFAAP